MRPAILLLLWLLALWAACGEAVVAPVDTGMEPPADSVGAPPEAPADTATPEPPPADSVAPEPPPGDSLPSPEIVPPARPDSVESIWLWPERVDSLPPGATVQFCVFANWSNGERGATTNSYGVPVCDSVLAANPRWKP